jgi:hypothetical protein
VYILPVASSRLSGSPSGRVSFHNWSKLKAVLVQPRYDSGFLTKASSASSAAGAIPASCGYGNHLREASGLVPGARCG